MILSQQLGGLLAPNSNPFLHNSVESGFNAFTDQPRFAQSQVEGFGGSSKSEGIGMKMLQKFLSSNEDDLKKEGAVYDETGADGLDPSEEIQPDLSEMRQRQRARSAAMVWVKQEGQKYSGFEAYGCSPDMEKVPNWLAYIVLLMGKNGDHKLLKVCIPVKQGPLAFVIQGGEICKSRIQTYEKQQQKTNEVIQKGQEQVMKKKVINLETNNKEENDSETKTHDEKAKESKKIEKQQNMDENDTDSIENQIKLLQEKLKQATEEKKKKEQLEKEKEKERIEKEKKKLQEQRFNEVNQDPEVPALKQEIGQLKSELSEIKTLLLQSINNTKENTQQKEEPKKEEKSSEDVQKNDLKQQENENEKQNDGKLEKQSVETTSKTNDKKETNESQNELSNKEENTKKNEKDMRFKQVDKKKSAEKPKYNFWGYRIN